MKVVNNLGEEKKEKLVVIIGPTAVGKTNLSIQLAKKLNGEIISGDSMQVYRGMDIGTAKIHEDEMEGIKHHLLDIKEPDESFSVAEFQQIVRSTITDIHNRNKMPIIVGGTGLYIQSVIYDYQFSDVPDDLAIRQKLEEEIDKNGVEAVYERLTAIDPESAKRMHPNNTRRVIRALSVFYSTGKTMTEWQKHQEHELLYDVALIGLTMERSKLYERINRRVEMMVDQGLINEVKGLYNRHIRDCQSIQAIGYKELYEYFDGKVTLDEALENLKQNSRRYAKRQLTWFRNKLHVEWFDLTDEKNNKKMNDEIFKYIAGKLKV